MVLAYVFWVAVTVLAVMGLGRLKRWLWKLAKKNCPEKQGS